MGGYGDIRIGGRSYIAQGMGYRDNLMDVILEGIQQAEHRAIEFEGSEKKHFKEFMDSREGWKRDDCGMKRIDETIRVETEDGKITGVSFDK